MVRLEPFTFEKCTAFRERKQIADKVNELVETLNDDEIFVQPETFETYREELQDYADTVDTFDGRITDVESDTSTLETRVTTVERVSNGNTGSINTLTRQLRDLTTLENNHYTSLVTHLGETNRAVSDNTDDIEDLNSSVSTLNNTTMKYTGNQTVTGDTVFVGTVSGTLVLSGVNRFTFDPTVWTKLYEFDRSSNRYEFTLRSVYTMGYKTLITVYNRYLNNVASSTGWLENLADAISGKLAYNTTTEKWELWIQSSISGSTRVAITTDFATMIPNYNYATSENAPVVGDVYSIVNDMNVVS